MSGGSGSYMQVHALHVDAVSLVTMQARTPQLVPLVHGPPPSGSHA